MSASRDPKSLAARIEGLCRDVHRCASLASALDDMVTEMEQTISELKRQFAVQESFPAAPVNALGKPDSMRKARRDAIGRMVKNDRLLGLNRKKDEFLTEFTRLRLNGDVSTNDAWWNTYNQKWENEMKQFAGAKRPTESLSASGVANAVESADAEIESDGAAVKSSGWQGGSTSSSWD